ncbi:hypothetical protein [Melissococcus plutonius]|uniref:hypothetical protein n=1 Tax=Melissococcus plutonius TaxID=33970 RepID=UPI0021E5941C|nr:hypothetical protein [Melissococcus plutonius]MCV2499663.1 hypothetical protein [Melissococcus plutonius]MCV2501951.1 hypothetical protein [Melissococcus plutonius]MCV2508276.1 hypothetical protein [Melissococcus plutonius]MCV2528121.1 hypothetical protein [Melissococcus plutonius]
MDEKKIKWSYKTEKWFLKSKIEIKEILFQNQFSYEQSKLVLKSLLVELGKEQDRELVKR